MPNWCNNNLILSGNLKELEKVQKDIEKGDFFNSILPIPTELADTQSPARDETQEQKDKNKALEEKHGCDNWYDWRVNNWGTKWDIDADSFYQNEIVKITDNTGKLLLAFDTAWAPPEGIYNAIVDQEILGENAYYYEPGCDFAGHYYNGHDDCITISDCDDDYFEMNDLGRSLDGYYNILESREMWREEEEADKKNEELKKSEVPNE